MGKNWKMVTGSIIFGVGGVFTAFSGKCPITELQFWLELLGQILMAIGGPLAAIGMAKKLDRNTEAVQALKK
jgi:hypothetical protein